MAEPVALPAIREPHDDERAFVRRSEQTLDARFHEEWVGGDAERTLDRERRTREEPARVTVRFDRTGEAQRD